MKVSWPKGTKWPKETVSKQAVDIYDIYETMHCDYCTTDCSEDHRRKRVFKDGLSDGPYYMVTICPDCEKKVRGEGEAMTDKNEGTIKKPLPDYRLMKKKSGELVLQQRFTLESYVRYDLVWEDVRTVEEPPPPEEG